MFCQILQDSLGLTRQQVAWTYNVPLPNGTARTLALDGRIELADISEPNKKQKIESWVREAVGSVLLSDSNQKRLRGCVFEVRQGYKSKDSKRQNADVANASNAYAHSYLPVVLLFSAQIDPEIAVRYTQAQWVILRGTTSGTAINSTYVFSKEILNYDLAGFFERNSKRLREELENVLVALLQA